MQNINLILISHGRHKNSIYHFLSHPIKSIVLDLTIIALPISAYNSESGKAEFISRMVIFHLMQDFYVDF